VITFVAEVQSKKEFLLKNKNNFDFVIIYNPLSLFSSFPSSLHCFFSSFLAFFTFLFFPLFYSSYFAFLFLKTMLSFCYIILLFLRVKLSGNFVQILINHYQIGCKLFQCTQGHHLNRCICAVLLFLFVVNIPTLTLGLFSTEVGL
jgi:hypothetical protein